MAISRGGDGRDCRCVRRLWPGGVFQRNAGERRHQRHLPTDVCPIVSPGIQFPNLRIAIHRHHFVPGALNFCPFVLFHFPLWRCRDVVVHRPLCSSSSSCWVFAVARRHKPETVQSMDQLQVTVFFLFHSFLERKNKKKQVMGNDRMTLSLLPANQGGRLSLSLSADANEFTTEAGFDLADNRWHDVDLRFHEDFLQIRLDGDWTPVVNASFVQRSTLFRRDDAEAKAMTVGSGFTGCLLQGPSFPLTSIDQHLRVSCPIPLGPDGWSLFKFLIKFLN